MFKTMRLKIFYELLINFISLNFTIIRNFSTKLQSWQAVYIYSSPLFPCILFSFVSTICWFAWVAQGPHTNANPDAQPPTGKNSSPTASTYHHEAPSSPRIIHAGADATTESGVTILRTLEHWESRHMI